MNEDLFRQNLILVCNNRSDFRQYRITAEQLERNLGNLTSWNIQETNFSTCFMPSQVDETARRIIPDFFTSLAYVPVRTTGDGNCLFNTTSLAMWHSEQQATELRLCTCIELALNRDFYKQHPVVNQAHIPYHSRKHGDGTMSIPTLFDIACFAAESSKVYQMQGFEAAFDNEIMRTSINYSYSGTLQIMGLASVLGVPLETVYLEQGHKLLPIYQNTFHPRKALGKGVVRIMWSNMNGWPDKRKEFVVNHFVPIFQQHYPTLPLNDQFKAEMDGEWHEVKHKAFLEHKAPNENEKHEAEEQIKLCKEKDYQEHLNQLKQLQEAKNDSNESQMEENENQAKTEVETSTVGRGNSITVQDTRKKKAECTEYLQSRSALPFPGASRRFYAKQNDKTMKNVKREQRRMETPSISDNNNVVGLQRSNVEGTLDENKESIENQIKECKDQAKRVQLLAVAEVAKELKKVLLMPTSRALEIYIKTKGKFTNANGQKESSCFRAIDTYEMLAKYLKVDQIYIDQQAFIVESYGTDIEKVVHTISGILEKGITGTANQTVKSCLKDCFKDVLCYLDTKRDRNVMEAIIAKISSVKSVISLKGTKFKESVRGHLMTLQSNLDKYKDIKQQTQSVRSDMTITQQYAHIARETEKAKKERMKTISQERGRKLKCDEFPELSKYIEFAFGEGDRLFRGGGGLQADRRLLDTKLFKAADNATVMRHVRELLATVKPELKISTSCLYTYTMNYRQGTAQAKCYHHGRDVNANVSLHAAPNTSEHVYPINAHCSSSHVNYLVDSASDNPNSFLLDSKDATCIVCGDISPVLKPRRSWRTFETPDHTFDQSCKNAVTPMTHLFMETKTGPRLENADLLIPETEVVLNVTRTGKAVTLINLSLTEPETVLQVFNEIFYLMSIPSLDVFFRNPGTGKLKEFFWFYC